MDLLTLLTQVVQSMAASETVVSGIVGSGRAGDAAPGQPDLRRPLESG
ncbi:hypothetical protein [Mycobacterium sp. ACS1612]|nr:hypothetical protein [Mycobacterium sp. ACS1612]